MLDTTSASVARSATTLPLTLLDEGLLHLQNARSEWNVQLELAADHRIDEVRLRQAVSACCRRHPLTRARLAPWRPWHTSYQWHVADDVDLDPVRVLDCPDDEALERIRADLYTPPVPLDIAPGLRVVLARRPAGDLVMLCTSHLVADGVGAVRLMQTITRTYRGEPDPADPLPLAQARDLGIFLRPATPGDRWSWLREAGRRIRAALDAPSRIAVDGGSAHRNEGCGFVRRTVDIGEAATPALARRAPGTTVNDVLLAALHLTVQSWNSRHGVATGRVGIMMPVNVRPADRLWDVVSNITSMVPVSTVATDRTDLATATAAVSVQTERLRRQERAHGLYDLLHLTRKAPLLLKRVAPRLLPLVQDRFVDTAMLSNLGRIPAPPSFDGDSAPAAEPPELWFSPPCDPACSVAIGVATVGDRLTLVTRYRNDQFDARAAEEFTDLLMSQFAPRADANRPRCGEPTAMPAIRVVSVMRAPAQRIDHRILGNHFRPGRAVSTSAAPASRVETATTGA
jgi:NRPS condensation-like uncharacterized protein